jgi:endonuclease YncB( thermonuclease family)
MGQHWSNLDSARMKAAIGTVLSLIVLATSAVAADLTGQASVIDADTLEIHGARIRLWGVDAPEADQLCRNQESDHYRCGQKAANDLDAFIGRRPIECVEVDRDQYKRAVAVVPSLVSISRNGWSRAVWRSTGPNIPRARSRQRSRQQSARTSECGAAAF